MSCRDKFDFGEERLAKANWPTVILYIWLAIVGIGTYVMLGFGGSPADVYDDNPAAVLFTASPILLFAIRAWVRRRG